MLTYSIVIPVYNVEKYLQSCLESVLAQDSPSSYEVILIDDGSKDGSGIICDQYAAHYDCINVIHQINQGVSAARNAGIAAAKGQYVLFLDSDDEWKPDMLSTLDDVIGQKPDMAVVGYEQFGENGGTYIHLPPVASSGLTGEAYFNAHSKINCMPIISCCSAAFRRDFLTENDLIFPIDVGYGEDFFFHLHALKRAQSVYSIQKPLYRYRENVQSITHTPTLKKTRELLATCAQAYHLFPCSMLADYYCMNILDVARHSREDAAQLRGLLRQNRDILRCVSGKKPRIARVLYTMLGYYRASKLVRFLIDARDSQK